MSSRPVERASSSRSCSGIFKLPPRALDVLAAAAEAKFHSVFVYDTLYYWRAKVSDAHSSAGCAVAAAESAFLRFGSNDMLTN
ncbi:hypothetical protein MRB53_039735 [Persea americana]|nr:hypothetical protein MRB53_039735 [Persea americana]